MTRPVRVRALVDSGEYVVTTNGLLMYIDDFFGDGGPTMSPSSHPTRPLTLCEWGEVQREFGGCVYSD